MMFFCPAVHVCNFALFSLCVCIVYMCACVCVCVCVCVCRCLLGRFFNSQSLAPGLQGSMGDCEGLRGISVDQNRSVGIIWDHWSSL